MVEKVLMEKKVEVLVDLEVFKFKEYFLLKIIYICIIFIM